jgi:hypothetical protein
MNQNQEGVRVNYACLHAPIFIPGAGQYGPTLTADATGKTKDLKMVLYDTVLSVETKGVNVLVPLSMVTHVVLAK